MSSDYRHVWPRLVGHRALPFWRWFSCDRHAIELKVALLVLLFLVAASWR